MQNKIIVLLSLCLFTAGCMDLSEPYSPYNLHSFSVQAVYPEGFQAAAGASVSIENISGSASYRLTTDASGKVSTQITNGIYRVIISDLTREFDIFNGSSDRVVVAGKDASLQVPLFHSRKSTLVIKEIYGGGCSKEPQEGTYQSDKYLIIHNNHSKTLYLDSLCFGTLAPYNSTGVNHWVDKDGNLPDSFVPIAQAVWMFPGDGHRFPLAPGEDAVVCMFGAIDHSAQYPHSVNLDKPDYFVCYSPLFPNPSYHPAPGPHIRDDHYMDLVIKVGQANAYTFSVSSPAVTLFKAKGVSMSDYVAQAGSVQLTPGTSTDWVVTIPLDWVIDAVEVFDGRSSNNLKRFLPSLDAGYVFQSEPFKGHTLMRYVNESASEEAGYQILVDTNNSGNDFYERKTQSLHE